MHLVTAIVSPLQQPQYSHPWFLTPDRRDDPIAALNRHSTAGRALTSRLQTKHCDSHCESSDREYAEEQLQPCDVLTAICCYCVLHLQIVPERQQDGSTLPRKGHTSYQARGERQAGTSFASKHSTCRRQHLATSLDMVNHRNNLGRGRPACQQQLRDIGTVFDSTHRTTAVWILPVSSLELVLCWSCVAVRS